MNAIQDILKSVFGRKINNTRVSPLTTKIVLVFTIIIFISNIASNYINLNMNRSELVSLMRQLLIKDLKEIYDFANTQYEIFQYNQDQKSAELNMEKKSLAEFKGLKSIAMGVLPDGSILFQAAKSGTLPHFPDQKALDTLNINKAKGVNDGLLTMNFNHEEYFTVYKYNPKWDMFIVRGEEENEFYQESRRIFQNIFLIIVIMTLVFSVIGVFMLQYITRFVKVITEAIIKMSRTQQLELIDLKGAVNDDITFLGVAFNALSNTVNNLLTIFKKFVNRDTAIKAYREKEVRLEGSQKDLTILFSDIKSFTHMTETLGTDIIKLLNLHYDRAIREIINHDGVIGSIIGDALLAVFGTLEDCIECAENKSYQALMSAYQIQTVAESLRTQMHNRREEITRERGALTDDEERIYRAVLLEVGVGIDGGDVFYGNIGSYERMTNTVIGDNVNSSSRLEGLTREYHVPVICSEYIKNDIERSKPDHGIFFLELDVVQVKGKTEGKRVYWPILQKNLTDPVRLEIRVFSTGLQHYYSGDWKQAIESFNKCTLPLADVFKERIENNKLPKDWKGIWTMKTK